MTEKDILDKVTTPAAAQAQPKVDFTRETAVFPFSWTSKTGHAFEGTFTNHILTVDGIGRVARATAQLNGGMPYESIPPMERDFHDRLSHLLVSLDAKDRPEWARDLLGLVHRDIIYALYRVVETHEGIFRGSISPEEGGPGDGSKPGA